MKSGSRAFGVAESYVGRDDDPAVSVLGGALVRADRVVDDLVLGRCTVGGSDATDAVVGLFDALDREDVQVLLIAGVAPAWFNLVDLDAVHRRVCRPVVSVSFEESTGLESALREQFSGADLDARLDRYRSLPPRVPVEVPGGTVFGRAVGLSTDETREVVAAFTPEGGRPEPLRVARQAARAGRRFHGGTG